MAELTDRFYIKSDENDNIIYISGAPATELNPLYVYKPRTDTTYTITSEAEVSLNADFDDKLELYSDLGSLYGMTITASKDFMVGGNIMSLSNNSTYTNEHVSFTTGTLQNFAGLFKNSSKLINAHDLLLPANVLKNSCYKEMFAGCSNLTIGPAELPATLLAESCYESMFSGCSKLTNTPNCKASSSWKRCFKNMFSGCSRITNAMQFTSPFTFYTASSSDQPGIMGEEMMGMYKNCALLTVTYISLDHGFTISCYESMFEGCTSLTTACPFSNTQYANGENALGTVKSYSCSKMYANTAVQTPVFPDTIPAAIEKYDDNGVPLRRKSTHHYNEMYSGCTSIRSVTLSGVDAGENMYNHTFNNCTNINTVNISFNTIDNYSANYMFNRCISLTSITLSISGITQWTETDSNNANVTKYGHNCCSHMFSDCTGLTTINNTITFTEGTYLTNRFCEFMFYNCSALNSVAITLPFYGNTDNDPTNDKRGEYACQNMFQKCSALNNINNIKFTGWLPSYALLEMFKECRNLQNINYTNIELYINGEGVCKSMFIGCTRLTNVSRLYIKGNLGKECCYEMFKDCTNLTTPPKDYFKRNIYPESCYYSMFSGCINLTSVEDMRIYADDNSDIQYMKNCFAYMFYDCRLLNTKWKGIRGKFSNGSCQYMFSKSGINSFGNITVLPAVTNNNMSTTFFHMFDSCVNLNVASEDEANIQYIKLDEAGPNATFGESCFEAMFKGCTSLQYMPIIYTGTADTNAESNNIKRKFDKKCFKEAFMGCTQLNGNTKTFKINGTSYTSDTIYANIFEEECFYDMFNGCASFDGDSMLNIIGVNNTDQKSILGVNGCYHMYINSGIKKMPCIKANTIKKYALAGAFINCSKLDTLPNNCGITATTTEEYAMYQAFKGNTTLTEIPPLYITNYGPHACEQMFMNTKITTLGTSMINARQVSSYSFYSMFENCTSLVTLADCILPGAYVNYQLVSQSDLEDPNNIYDYPKYSYMANSIRYNYFYGPIPGESGISYYYIIKELTINGQKIIPPKVALSDYTFARMFYGCTNLTAPPQKMNNVFYGTYSCYLMFANTGLTYTPELTAQKYIEATEPRLEDDNQWYVRVSNNAPMSGSGITATTPDGKTIYKQTTDPIIEELPEGAFCGMFMNTKITTLPSIYAKKVGKNGCNSMFRDCKYLTEITYINFNINSGDVYAFSHMFNNCRNLKFAASLGATETTLFTNLRELKSYACCGMFANCVTLQKIIKFNNLSSVAEGTFASMYLNCGGLTGTVKYDFSTTTIGKASFTNMFRNCEGITSCELKFGTLQRSCCENMFMACYGLTSAKVEFNDQVASSYALAHMFYNCTALSNVWCNMRIGFSFELTHEWLLNVSPTGIYHHSSLINQNLIVRDTSSVPEGWTCAIGYEMGGDA